MSRWRFVTSISVSTLVCAAMLQAADWWSGIETVSNAEAALQYGGACAGDDIACTNWDPHTCTGTNSNCVTTGRLTFKATGISKNKKAIYPDDYVPCGAWFPGCGAYCGFVFDVRDCGL